MLRRIIPAVSIVIACGDPANPGTIPTTYAYRAEGAVDCFRNPQNQCQCDAPGFHEGTLTLMESDGRFHGTLEVRTCMPGEPCSALQSHPVVAGRRLASDSVYFALNTTEPTRPHNGWAHLARIDGTRLIGRHSRSDFSTNGCGDDLGPFTATVQR